MSIPAGLMPSLRRLSEHYTMPDTCGIVTVTRTNVEGGTTETESAPVNVACRVAPLTGRDAAIAAAEGFTAEYVVTLPAETAITAHDRVIWNGATYEVNGPAQVRTDEIIRRVFVVRGG